MNKMTTAYRPDIDGLRAWAVMLVVIYHAGIGCVPGGYMGVDVFFVISGYLITNIITREMEQGHFSLLRFYERRIRRIIPALVVMTISILVLGTIWILPVSFERISGSALAAMLFLANFHFWKSASNYFAPASETDPFLHTWSLAVEEQFYLLFPVLFVLLFQLGRRRTVVNVMGLLLVASFVLTLTSYAFAPTATFFFPIFRAWEFLVGALLAMGVVPTTEKRIFAGAGTLTGLSLLVFAAIYFDSTIQFPGWVTLLPVIGSALIIHFGGQSGMVGRVTLSAEPVRRIGRISYSLYLWHWPVFVLAEHYILDHPLGALEVSYCIALSFVLAYLSYRFVEQPFRHGSWFQRSSHLFITVIPMALVAVVSAFVIFFNEGLRQRYPDFANFSISSQTEVDKRIEKIALSNCFEEAISGRRISACYLGPRGEGNAMIWGDSFALHYLTALTEYAFTTPSGKNRGLISFASPQCPPIIGYDPVNLPSCKDINDRALEIMHEMNVDTVVLSANWFNYALVNRVNFADVRDTVAALKAKGLTVVLIGQSPIFNFSAPEEALFSQMLQGVTRSSFGASINRVPTNFNQRLQMSANPDMFFDPTLSFCDKDECQIYEGGNYLFRDYGHLTLQGSRRVIFPLMEELGSERWLARN
jgi:peptidoglycan/LPS O-acetylase OafA/YrhL